MESKQTQSLWMIYITVNHRNYYKENTKRTHTFRVFVYAHDYKSANKLGRELLFKSVSIIQFGLYEWGQTILSELTGVPINNLCHRCGSITHGNSKFCNSSHTLSGNINKFISLDEFGKWFIMTNEIKCFPVDIGIPVCSYE